MSNTPQTSSNRLLDPMSRIMEVLFGLIMVLTFTGSLSVATASREDTREMLIGALGCNFAWGLVDAVMYLMTNLTTRARTLAVLRSVRGAADPKAAHRVISDALPPEVAEVVEASELEAMRSRLVNLPDPTRARMLHKDDWLGAIGVFLLVFLSTLPVVVPFMFMTNAPLALRISNGIAIVMLFACGYSLGRYAGVRGWLVGLIMVLVGSVLAGMTLALGG